MTNQHVSDTLKTAIAHTVDKFVDEIRAKARADHADELQQAGHAQAADYLRTNR